MSKQAQGGTPFQFGTSEKAVGIAQKFIHDVFTPPKKDPAKTARQDHFETGTSDHQTQDGQGNPGDYETPPQVDFEPEKTDQPEQKKRVRKPAQSKSQTTTLANGTKVITRVPIDRVKTLEKAHGTSLSGTHNLRGATGAGVGTPRPPKGRPTSLTIKPL